MKYGVGKPADQGDDQLRYPVELLVEGRPIGAIAWTLDADWAARIADALQDADIARSDRDRRELRLLLGDL